MVGVAVAVVVGVAVVVVVAVWVGVAVVVVVGVVVAVGVVVGVGEYSFMNTARILELLDEREYPITGDSPLARYALELRDAIAALREEVSRLTENQRQQDSATAFVMERDEKERDALRKEVEEYKSEYFRVHNLKMDAIEARLAAERELAACKENAERYRWLRDCDTEDIPTMGGELMAREALDEHIDAAIKAARKV